MFFQSNISNAPFVEREQNKNVPRSSLLISIMMSAAYRMALQQNLVSLVMSHASK